MTAARVISEPVPAVVGIANSGVPGFLHFCIPSNFFSGPGLVCSMATILAAAVKVVVNEDRRPIFGAEADRSVTGFVIVAAILVQLGGLARGIVGSQMADALDVAVIEGSVDGGVGLWIFEVPLSSVTFITLAMSFLYGRARRLQEEVETIV